MTKIGIITSSDKFCVLLNNDDYILDTPDKYKEFRGQHFAYLIMHLQKKGDVRIVKEKPNLVHSI